MPKLEWIAVLKFKDGLHTFRQPSEDPSVDFQKVLEYEKKGELVSFFLDEPSSQRSLGVNLITGQFIFSMIYNYHPAPKIIDPNPTYRLIHFRRKHRDIGTQGYDSGVILATYILGWQITINDENIQRMMFIDAKTCEVTIKEKR